MKLREQIKKACLTAGISIKELGIRAGYNPSNFYQRVRRGTFNPAELQDIAARMGATYKYEFVFTQKERCLECTPGYGCRPDVRDRHEREDA